MMIDPAVESESVSAAELIGWAMQQFGDRFAVVTSFQREGMVVLDMAVRMSRSVRIITLDTGRLPPETFDMMELVYHRYGLRVQTVLPDPQEASNMVARFGPNLFLESVGHRRLCCAIRKVRPLGRALEGIEAYAVGLRRGQSESRDAVPKLDRVDGRWKLSPLADWTAEQVLQYSRENDVPEHPLYLRGYGSIGCAPCTRALHPGEAERAGRWWWEQGVASECGLHFSPDGKVERTVDVLLREILSS
jgi:phosphoadenylyl-sulfate reductase (thioredoxin)